MHVRPHSTWGFVQIGIAGFTDWGLTVVKGVIVVRFFDILLVGFDVGSLVGLIVE